MLRLIQCSTCAGLGHSFAGVQTRLCASCDGRGFNYVFEPDPKLEITVRSDTGEPEASQEVA